MGLTDQGAIAVAALVAGAGTITPFNAANAYIAVGDSAAAEATSQTDLQGVNKTRKLVDSVAIAANAVDYTATYGTTQANHAWLEIAVTNAALAGTMLSRKVISLGIKPNTEQWSVTATVVYLPS